jgi:hypothetical protein
VLSKLGEMGAAWVAVDRSIAAAEEADDPLPMAAGAFRLAIVFQNGRHLDLATQVAKTAVNALGRLIDAGEPEAVALRGALYLQLAVAASRRTPCATHATGRSSVELGDAGRALRVADNRRWGRRTVMC